MKGADIGDARTSRATANFYDTPVQTILTHLGRDTIIICGYSSEAVLRSFRARFWHRPHERQMDAPSRTR